MTSSTTLAQSTSGTQELHHPLATSQRQTDSLHPATNTASPVVVLPQNPLDMQSPQARLRKRGLYVILRDLPPEEQERVIANSARFHRLPAQRQAQIRRNLQRWNGLSPEQKQIIREREAMVQSLSLAQRQELRAIFPLYRRLPPERRQALMRAFLHLRNLPRGERPMFLSGSKVQEQLSTEERGILARLGQLLSISPP